MTKNKIGFACKWIDTKEQINLIGPKDPARELNTKSTTITWLARQTREVAEQRLWDIMVSNILAIHKLIVRVGALPPHRRMVRISSDVLPAYTHVDYRNWYRRTDVQKYLEDHLSIVGDSARNLGVRLSFHPGQFCVLASISDGIVQRSIEEMEYHTDIARFMGYGKKFQDMKINVHISGKRGPQGIKDVLPRLSPEARNMITIENDEMSWGIDSSIELVKDCALVLDIHHHWIRTGEYIQPNDIRFEQITESWRGVTPVIHYSVSREDVLPAHSLDTLPDHAILLSQGHNKSKLRAHSDFYWNKAVNNWAGSFHPYADIMCESKGKNIASLEFAEQVV